MPRRLIKTPPRKKSTKTKVRERTKKKAGRGAAAGFKGANKRGAAGFRQAKQEQENQKRKNSTPFRLGLSADETAKVIILDDQPFFRHEHHWKGPDGIWNQFDACIKASGHCPLCEKLGAEGYYAMFLTVIDRRAFTTKAGDKYKYSRKLLPIKNTAIPKYERMYKRKETFRGMSLELYRDNGSKTQRIGDPEFVGWASDTRMAKYVDKEKKPFEVIDYEEVFPYPTEKEMRQRYGGTTPLGGEDTESDDDDPDNLDDAEWD